MEIICQNCQSRFSVADEKLPAGRTLTVKCPKCQGRIEINTGTQAQAAPQLSGLEAMVSEVDSSGFDAWDKPFDYVQVGMQTALVCEHDSQAAQKIRRALESMNHHVVEADSARSALKYMRFHVYDLIVLNETFEAADAESNPVLQYLAQLPMYIRRNMFVALVGSNMRTMDNMMAFNRSVNLVVNLQEADDMENVLRSAVAEHNEFYQVFKEVLKGTSRAP